MKNHPLELPAIAFANSHVIEKEAEPVLGWGWILFSGIAVWSY
jgi:hypothetical protein